MSDILKVLQSLTDNKPTNENFKIAIQYNYKHIYESFLYKILLENRNTHLLNFDINYYNYIKNRVESENNKEKGKVSHFFIDADKNDFNSQSIDKYIVDDSKIYILNGVDLISKEYYKDLINSLLRMVKNVKRLILFYVLEKEGVNLESYIEKNNEIFRNRIENNVYFLNKQEDKSNLLFLVENISFKYMTKSFYIFKYNINNGYNFVEVDLYKKEYQNVFEKEEDGNGKVPESTFSLSKTNEDEKNKLNVIVPYLKENNENLIQVENDDINELYEEDPDEDLDI